ncbi:hypothetical protein BDF21DRAFT_397660 [Thamnidium elegans]|nr:hypothetical protein BDF21DRAFT_397660 [Thamnidium elegans]
MYLSEERIFLTPHTKIGAVYASMIRKNSTFYIYNVTDFYITVFELKIQSKKNGFVSHNHVTPASRTSGTTEVRADPSFALILTEFGRIKCLVICVPQGPFYCLHNLLNYDF